MVASDGTVFERGSTNAQSCTRVNYSISKSENGTSRRWPILTGQGQYDFTGGFKLKYQDWLDIASGSFYGICYDGWRYVKGIRYFNVK